MLGEVIGDPTVASRQLAAYGDKIYKAVTNWWKITNCWLVYELYGDVTLELEIQGNTTFCVRNVIFLTNLNMG